MGLLEFFGRLVSTKRSLNYLIESVEYSYWKHKKLFPGHDTHVYLSQAWLALMQSKGVNVDDPEIKEASHTSTYFIACLPEPVCARALGPFLAFRERPEDFSGYPQFENEFNELIKPVIAAESAGELDILYKQQNPSCDLL